MQKILTNKIFLFSLAGVTLLLLVLPLFIKKAPPVPQVVSSVPPNKAQTVPYFDPIVFNFDQPLSLSDLSFTSIPEEVWLSSRVDEDTVSIKSAQYLRVDTAYSLTILYKNSPIYTYTFKVAPQQSDPRYTQEVMSELERDYPLAAKTPYNEPGFSVLYSTPLTLEITLKTDSVAPEEVVGAVREWVRSHGLDPESHNYTFAN